MPTRMCVIELILEYVRKRSNAAIQQHVEQRLRQFTNAKTQKLIGLLGSFDPDWRKDLEAYLIDEYKDAVDGIVDIRNTLSHGRFSGVTIVRIKDYYARITD